MDRIGNKTQTFESPSTATTINTKLVESENPNAITDGWMLLADMQEMYSRWILLTLILSVKHQML